MTISRSIRELVSAGLLKFFSGQICNYSKHYFEQYLATNENDQKFEEKKTFLFWSECYMPLLLF